MRLYDAMTPARSPEEAAMTKAKPPTLLGGAALSSLRAREMDENLETVEIEKGPAAQENQSRSALRDRRRRAALRHVLERQF